MKTKKKKVLIKYFLIFIYSFFVFFLFILYLEETLMLTMDLVTLLEWERFLMLILTW